MLVRLEETQNFSGEKNWHFNGIIPSGVECTRAAFKAAARAYGCEVKFHYTFSAYS